jgi:hypothetical protein
MGGKRLEYECDPAVAATLVEHFEAINVAQRTIDTQRMIINKILCAHFEGYRVGDYEYNPNRQKFERKHEPTVLSINKKEEPSDEG